jgi:hypothetical protein
MTKGRVPVCIRRRSTPLPQKTALFFKIVRSTPGLLLMGDTVSDILP